MFEGLRSGSFTASHVYSLGGGTILSTKNDETQKIATNAQLTKSNRLFLVPRPATSNYTTGKALTRGRTNLFNNVLFMLP